MLRNSTARDYLRSWLVNVLKSDDGASYRSDAEEEDSGKNASCTTWSGTDLRGHDGPGDPCSVKASSVAECCDKCSAESGCIGWTYMPNTGPPPYNCCFKKSTAGRRCAPRCAPTPPPRPAAIGLTARTVRAQNAWLREEVHQRDPSASATRTARAATKASDLGTARAVRWRVSPGLEW